MLRKIIPIFLLTLLDYGLCSKGCVQLDVYSFDKITSKFDVSLIKFDTAYPYGPKHDAFEAVCESAHTSSDLLIGEVQVKDYGEKDNEELAERFKANKDNFPVVILFAKGKEPVTFKYEDDKQFTTDHLKRFIRANSDAYIGLLGCLEDFDKLVLEFINSKSTEERKKILKKGEDLWDKAKGNRDYKSAETYVKLMRKVLEKGDEFVTKETSRVENILKGKLSKDKKSEMQERINILQSFKSHDEL